MSSSCCGPELISKVASFDTVRLHTPLTKAVTYRQTRQDPKLSPTKIQDGGGGGVVKTTTTEQKMADQIDDTTNNDHLVQSSDPEHPANLIPELCRKFYHLGWVTGTGGGVSPES